MLFLQAVRTMGSLLANNIFSMGVGCMFENYEKFKKDVLTLTKIDLNSYKER
jgi:hypothetical protein